MHKTLFLALVILFYRQAHGQQATLEQLREKGELLLDEEKYREALTINIDNLNKARQQGEFFYEALFLHNIALSWQHLNEDQQALTYYERAFALAEKNNFTQLLNNIYCNRAIVYRKKGQYAKAMRDLIAARTSFEQQHDLNGLYAVYNSMGNIELLRHNSEEALSYYQQAVTLLEGLMEEHVGNPSMLVEYQLDMGLTLNNIGEIYIRRGQYQLALQTLNTALSYKQKSKQVSYCASTILALGIVYDSLKQWTKADSLIQEAYQQSKIYHNRLTHIQSCGALASLYSRQQKYQDALSYLDISLELAKKDSLQEELLQNFDIRRKLYRKTGQLTEALAYDDLYFETEQYLRNIEKEKEIEDLKARYELDRTTLQLEQSKEQNNWLVLVIVIVAALLVSIAFAYRQKKKSRDKIELLMRELNHRVKNNLQVLLSMINLQQSQLIDQASKDALKATQSRIMAMSFIHRKLYKEKEFTLIDIGEFIKELVEDLRLVYCSPQQQLTTHYQIQLLELEADKAIPLGLLINEIVTNAFKYALVQHPHGILHISLSIHERDISLSISDNGPGYEPDPANRHNGFGTSLVSTLARQLKGSLHYKNNQGTTVTLHFRK